MNLPALFISALIILPAIGLVTWLLFAIAKASEDLRAFAGFEGMHFEECPLEIDDTVTSGATILRFNRPR